ncbi:MAG: transposase [Candidatus Accumulibacter sp.]|uniref:Transposase n=1 Tax=Accumulibacter regalis TaxID=522306 RepID=C7RV05_ACCRE|nr:transposase [Accumulibacter sp.]MBN8499057.1 transposase [Accumulibacter sp.]MBO3715013.1 transposase [Accumulibacter sp.]
MTGPRRRAFQAAMALKYCSGSARRAEDVFGWSRQAVQLGRHEKRTGIVCLGLHTLCCGARLSEKKHPEVAQALWALAESHAQQDPTSRTTLSFTRLRAEAAIEQLRAQGFADDVLPSRSGVSEVLNRNGYRLRPVLKAKPQENSLKPTPSSPISGDVTAIAKTKPSCA